MTQLKLMLNIADANTGWVMENGCFSGEHNAADFSKQNIFFFKKQSLNYAILECLWAKNYAWQMMAIYKFEGALDKNELHRPLWWSNPHFLHTCHTSIVCQKVRRCWQSHSFNRWTILILYGWSPRSLCKIHCTVVSRNFDKSGCKLSRAPSSLCS